MSEPATLAKLQRPLSPLVGQLALDPGTQALLAGVPDAAAAFLRLVDANVPLTAIRLAAHALPKREAVWWACMCARSVTGRAAGAAELAALEAAEAWVRRPSETARRSARDLAEAADERSPEAWAARAVSWAGGSLAPDDQPVVPPPEHLTGIAVASSIGLAAVSARPERAEERYARFLASAREIATGGAGKIAPE